MKYSIFDKGNKPKQPTLMIILLLVLVIFTTSVKSQEQMKQRNFKLAIVQMKVEGGKRSQNLKRAALRIQKAAENGAQVVLLPEAMDLGWTDPSALHDAQPIPEGETAVFLSSMARKYGVYLCSGLIEKDSNKVYNSAVIFNPEGELILKHHKVNELDIGHPYYALGEQLNVAETEYGTFGLMICADATAKDHVLTRSLGYMGADIILSPCSWAMPADHDNEKEPYGDTWCNSYMPVAREFRVWIAGASNVGWMTAGPWKGWKGIGSSMIVNPDGEVALQAPYGVEADTVMYVDVSLEDRPGQGTTWHKFWNKKK